MSVFLTFTQFFQIVIKKDMFRSSHRRWSVTKGDLRDFAKLTGKHLCQGLFFNKVASLRPATLLKKRLWHRCFPVKFSKVLRTPFVTEHVRPATFLKKRPWHRCFLVNFAKFLRTPFVTEHLRPAALLKNRFWCRCFSVNFVKFLRTLFVTEHLRWLLLYV